MDYLNYEQVLRQFLKEDIVYQRYLNKELTEMSDYDDFCVKNCQAIESMLKDNEQQRAVIHRALQMVKEAKDCDLKTRLLRVLIDREEK